MLCATSPQWIQYAATRCLLLNRRRALLVETRSIGTCSKIDSQRSRISRQTRTQACATTEPKFLQPQHPKHRAQTSQSILTKRRNMDRQNSDKNQVSPPQTLWSKANELLVEQKSLRQQLILSIQKSRTLTGLYLGEAPEDFPPFVQHVRKVLSRSPRTILRQALQSAHNESRKINQERLQELCSVLHLQHDASLFDIGQSMDVLTKGKVHRWLEIAKDRLNTWNQIESAEEGLREKIATGLSLKRGCSPTSTEIQQAVNRALAKRIERRNNLQEQVCRLEKSLQDDPEYMLYRRATRLWNGCGGENIWTNFKTVDLAISKSRKVRGDRFENSCCDLVFAMIVAGQRFEESDKISDFWYEHGAHWWQGKNVVGEMDIVVHHKSRGVVAVCEMKSAYFEIAVASRQHETKLEAAAKCEESDIWAIGKTREVAVKISGRARIPLFVATILPSGEFSGLVGVEPLLVRAVCQGIRAQGKHIVHASNLHLCNPLVAMMDQDRVPVGDAIEYLESLPDRFDSPHEENDLDYDQLRRVVLEEIGLAQLDESLSVWLERFPEERIFVLPVSFVA